MKPNKIILSILIGISALYSYGQSIPEKVVSDFGEAIEKWCKTEDFKYREIAENLCDGLKKCRVEDKIHADYQTSQGFRDYDTFVLDSYLNMFENEMSDGLSYKLSDIKVVDQDHMPDGQILTFITANIKVSGKLNHSVEDLFLVRDDKISGIYSYSSQLGFSHLNGSLIEAIHLNRFKWSAGFRNGYAVVSNETGNKGLIDMKGKLIVPCVWDDVSYHGGTFALGYNYKRDNQIDNQENAVYDLRFQGKRTPLYRVEDYLVGRNKNVITFCNGYAVVQNKEGKFGYLNENDTTYSVKYCYDSASRFSEGYAIMEYNGSLIITKISNDKFNIVDVLDANRYGVSGAFHDGLAALRNKNTGKIGFINTKCDFVIPCEFDDTGHFSEGICDVQKYDEKSRNPYYETWHTALIDKKGNLLTAYEFEQPWGDFEDGYIEMTKLIDDKIKSSLIDKNGNPIPGFNWNYDNIRHLCDGYARFEIDDKFGFLNEKGEVVIPPLYDTALFFNEGLSCVGKEINGKTKYGCINKDGVTIIPFIYDDSFNFTNGIALVIKEERLGLIDTFGNSYFFDSAEE